jgi:energy-coupling factor transport system permease protein
MWPSGWMAALAALLVSIAMRWANIPAGQIVRVWRLMAPLVVLVLVLTALFTHQGTPWFQLGPIAVTPSGVERGAMLALRLLALTLLVFLWLFTTDEASAVKSFRTLGMPYSWALTLSLALRYLPIFAGIFTQIREAQQARGLDLDSRGLWGRLRAYRPILITMIIQALRLSEQLGWALEVRAVGATGVKRTMFRPLRLTRTDRLAALFLALFFVAAVLLRLMPRG